MLPALLTPLLTHSFFSDNLLAKFWPWMCSLLFVSLLWVDRLFSTGPHLHQKAFNAYLNNFEGSMISLVNVLRDCLSIIACLICVWSHAWPWSHLLARSLCHPLFHLIDLSQEVITPCLLAKSLVFSETLTFDRLIARSLARPLSRLPTFSLAYWLARSQSYWSTPKTEQKTSSRLGWVAGKPFTVACMFPIACSYVFFLLPACPSRLTCLPFFACIV